MPTRTLERVVLERRGAVVDYEPEVRCGELGWLGNALDELRDRDVFLVSRVRPGRRTALAAGRLIERQRARRIAARRAWRNAWKRLDRAGDAEWR